MGIIDIAIVAVFLIVTLIIGIGSSSKIKTMKDYALGEEIFLLER